MKDHEEHLGFAERGVQKALALGADAAEVFIIEGHRMSLTHRGGFATPTESHSVGIGVRVAVGKRIGLAGSSGLHRMEEILTDAVDSAKTAPETPGFTGFTTPKPCRPTPTEVPEALYRPDPLRLQETVLAAVEALDREQTTFHSATVTAGSSQFVVANSNGVAAWDRGGREAFDLELRVSDGGRDVTAWDSVSRIRPLSPDEDIVPLAVAAHRRAVGALRPVSLDRPVDSVVLTDSATGQIMARFIAAFSGSLIKAGQSPLTDKIGTPVAASALTLIDFPEGPDDLPRLRVDHEGTPTGTLKVVDKGVACGVFHDSVSGNGSGGSNGRGLRLGGWAGGIRVAPLFLTMVPGDHTLEGIIAETDRAVLIEEPMTGMLTANVTTGDFSAVIPYAYLIERGEVRDALPNVTIGGNVHRMVREIEAVGDTVIERRQGAYAPIRTRGVSCAT